MRPEDHDLDEASPRRAWLLPLTLVGLGAMGWACQDLGTDDGQGDDAGMVDPDGVTRRAVLESIAQQVLVPKTAAFVESAAALRAATEAWAADGSPESLEVAQAAWRDAMHGWQELEPMQVGPAAGSLVGIGGEDRRDAIYSWPTADACSVDRALVDGSYAEGDFFSSQLVWAYGLDALEYLLFHHGEGHACPSQVQLDAPWAALGIEEVEARRADYAVVVAGGVVAQADALARRWSPQADDFAAALAHPGEGGSPYGSDLEALDEVFRAMFYLDLQTKDYKLGVPMGLLQGCAAPPCADLIELGYSHDSAAAVAANLRGLRLLVTGGPDPETADGFDDLLDAVGERALADELLAEIDEAIALADALQMPLAQALVEDPARVDALHEDVKDVTNILKGPFVMSLMLTVPAEGAGDND